MRPPKIDYAPEVLADPALRAAAERGTELLRELQMLTPEERPTDVEWSAAASSGGEPVLLLRLHDYSGDEVAVFKPAELTAQWAGSSLTRTARAQLGRRARFHLDRLRADVAVPAGD